MDLTFSIVRGRSLKSGSTTREASTGFETTCSVNWHSAVLTSWDLTCSYVTAAGTGQNTAGSPFSESLATTSFTCLATRATSAVRHLATTTEWCYARTTETPTAHTKTTVQCSTVVDSSTRRAATAESMLYLDVERLQMVLTGDWKSVSADISHVAHVLDHFTDSASTLTSEWNDFLLPHCYIIFSVLFIHVILRPCLRSSVVNLTSCLTIIKMMFAVFIRFFPTNGILHVHAKLHNHVNRQGFVGHLCISQNGGGRNFDHLES